MKSLHLVWLCLLGGCQTTEGDLTHIEPGAQNVAHQLKFVHNRLDVISLLGGKACLPASIKSAEAQLAVARASFEGALYVDAANALIITKKQLQKIDKRLDYLKRNTPCAEDQAIHPALLSSLTQLLNSNNQFAFGQSKLTVSYQNNLEAAAALLNKMPYMRLELTGHTDDVGSDTDNHSLSLARAEAVKAFLITHSVDEQRLTIKSAGEKQPLTTNRDSTGQLANRRVDVALVINPYQPNNTTLALKHWHKVLSPIKP